METKQFIELTQQHKIVPVFYHSDIEVVIQTIQASYDAGVRIFEFVNRGDNGLESFTRAVKHFHDYSDLCLGVGTLFDVDTATGFVAAGAQFMVSPGWVDELARYAATCNLAYIPGIATISEAITAKNAGCQMIKIFPANVVGPAFAKAVASVLPDLAIMPTGGIEPTKESMGAWFKAGVNCVGMGSQLFDKKKIADGDFHGLAMDIRQAVQTAKACQI
ncbi:bifunctional 4-hydroxy-2-oxoglutarate aldolase/2-dehydro-3-deoxy-phosphogluconate aldolase [Nonlabens xiamenensis]|uniref:bifunctional 4-hydroxy-2-oxoglutarate aldolase/2-dehydro-3-deoxy-phosphogluconate aldolase n=1 Tax=Nonlabens xiamenensis TaxID=2341043 RepID=UPI000F60B8C6|nr:bifunctional 4-hydroxy-2-oxoglutarate aldolase/2-dehydro-3-deoxy-phosphogluconate aldolase [Nonlabens xiamenensis]